jgi:SAM-dependent methyltransferase
MSPSKTGTDLHGQTNTAPRVADPAASMRPRAAWTEFWKDADQSVCVAGAADIQRSLRSHWSAFAASLAPGSRVLDLGCGAGAVARALSTARPDVHITGIDFARIPLAMNAHVELLSDTAMESLPFAEASFGAVTSQFGYEYSSIGLAAREIARVVAPGGKLSLLVHHADSAIVATNRVRLAALNAFLAPEVSAAFCGGDGAALAARLSALAERYPTDSLVAELTRELPSRLGRAPRERLVIWRAVADALAPERCLAQSLDACCVAAADLDEWLRPLRDVCALQDTSVLREPDGTPVAWQIAGTRAG